MFADRLTWVVARPLLVGVSIAVLLAVAALVWSVRDATEEQARADISADIASLLQQEERFRVVAVIDAIDHRLAALPADRQPAVYLLMDPHGVPVTGNLARWPDADAAGGDWITFVMQGTDGRRTRVLASKRIVGGVYPLLVGRRLDTPDRIMAQAWPATLAAAMIGAVLIGLSLARSGNAVADEVQSINEVLARGRKGELSARIGETRRPREFERLVEEVNQMLDTVERQVLTMRNVASQAAHELRTPLARLRTRLADGGNYRYVEDLDAAIDLLQSILDLAEHESELGSPGDRVDLATIAAQVVDLYEVVAVEKGVGILVAAETAIVIGDPALLQQLLANLVDNALRYAPRGSHVQIGISRTGRQAKVSVEDKGPGVGGRSFDELVEDISRHGRTDVGAGYGLGLRFARAIALRHGGRIRIVEPENEGTQFIVTLIAEDVRPDRFQKPG